MIFPNSVMNAIFTILSSNSVIVDSGINIDLNLLRELDPNRMPWIGIYNASVSVEPHRVQRPNPWLVTYNPQLIILNSQFNFNQEEVQDTLDKTLTIALSAINCHDNHGRTLNDTVDAIKGFEIEPFEQDFDEDNTLLGYAVTIIAEVRR